MAISNTLQGHPDAAQLRKAAGAYIKKLRADAGLTQQEISKQLGLDYYTLISQIELGRTRVPVERLRDFAEVLKVDPYAFGMRLLSYYDPYTFDLIKNPPSSP